MSDRQRQLDQALEAMFFGFRAMTYHPDRRLAELGLSRVHHRLLYFIARYPDCSINELLGIMRISKQYLHQPLKKLVALGYVKQRGDRNDRRVRRLRLSARGSRLEFELTDVQRRRFADIFKRAGPAAEKNWREVMALLGAEFEF